MELLRRFLVGLLGMIDAVVYTLISWIYNLLLDIANAEIFTNEFFANFASRVYALLGLFMLFKVSFSLIQYIINPDDFKDKIKGGKKLVLNILIVLILIIATPEAFKIMDKIEKIILRDNVVDNLIFGAGVGDNQKVDKANMGDRTKMLIFTAFYKPDDPNCASALLSGDTGAASSACSGILSGEAVDVYIRNFQEGSVAGLVQEEVPGDNEPLFMIKIHSGDDSEEEDEGSDYAINYMFIVSTIAGIFTALIFLNFCIDIAIRTVKLGFLQLISPVPIISYIDPKSSQNGMFNKWLKEVGKTYADLFIRLAAVYLAITLISHISISVDSGSHFVTVFVIFGILIFANQIPRLIGDLLGVKIEGNFSLNPMSKINASPIAGAVAGGIAGGALGMASNIAAKSDDIKKFAQNADDVVFNGQVSHLANKFGSGAGNFKKAVAESAIGKGAKALTGLASPLAGGVSAMARGAMGASKGKGSALAAGVQGATASSRVRNAREGGFSTMDRLHDKFTDIAGIRSQTGTTSEIEDKIKTNQLQISNYKRDENSYSQQLADIARANPVAYNQAFEEEPVIEHDEIQRKDDGGILTKRTYDSYEAYVKSVAKLTDAQLLSGVEERINHGEFSNDINGREAAKAQILANQAQQLGLISKAQYDAYDNVMKQRDKADNEARKLEKRNRELQGYLDAKTGKPKNKN